MDGNLLLEIYPKENDFDKDRNILILFSKNFENQKLESQIV